MDTRETCNAAFRKDTVGKVFIVFSRGTGRCLICDATIHPRGIAGTCRGVLWPGCA
jgi:hypothetical protein